MELSKSLMRKMWSLALVLTLGVMLVEAYGRLPPRRAHPLFVGKRPSQNNQPSPCSTDMDCPDTYCCVPNGFCLRPGMSGELCLVHDEQLKSYHSLLNGLSSITCGGCEEGFHCYPITRSGVGRCRRQLHRRLERHSPLPRHGYHRDDI